MKIAFCVIVKPTDEEAVFLDRLLENIESHVDGIFVTITGKNKMCEQVSKKYNAHVSHYEWDFNFANARNFNFSQVSSDYTHIMWGDADDMFKGMENLRDIVESNDNVDAFPMNYFYDFDNYKNPTVVHMKTQIVKNDGCVEWAGALHEDFKENRRIVSKFIKDVSRVHIRGESRVREGAERNYEIAKKEVQNNPNDPRSYWNLANSSKLVGQKEESLEAFNKFMSSSQSDEERYLARLRVAEMHMEDRDWSSALENVNFAIGLRPMYPNAYHVKGEILYHMNRFEEARDSVQQGLTMKPPYFSIIVFNPRDYDYNPLMLLAKIYLGLSMPQLALVCIESCVKIQPEDTSLKKLVKEMKIEAKKAEKALEKYEVLKKIKNDDEFEKQFNKISPEIRQHPALCNLRNTRIIKRESSGRDLVFYCGYTHEEWTPDSIKGGIGGSEEAIINLSRGLAKKGWNVTVYNSCGYKELDFDGVSWKPFWSWNPRDKQDVVVLWRHARPLEYDINADKVYVDLHDVLPEGELVGRHEKVTKIMVKSQAQRDLYTSIPNEKFLIIPNGVDISLFEKDIKRDPYLLVNFSSPDRALETILDILPEVKKRLPKKIADKVQFVWHYGWSVFDNSNTSEIAQSWKRDIVNRFNNLVKEGWVFGGGRVSHEEVAKLNLRAGAIIYPSSFYEIDWVGGTKAQIAGCLPIVTDFAAIGEKAKYGVKAHSKKTIEDWDDIENQNFGLSTKEEKQEYVDKLVEYLKNPKKYEKEREKMASWAKEEYNWGRIVDLWDKEFMYAN